MSDHSSDSWLDEQLRETPLPEDFLVRLRAIARQRKRGRRGARRGEDESLDRLLREVQLPEGLKARIRAAASRSSA